MKKPLLSPKGNEIVGTLETVSGVADIDVLSAKIKNGKINFEYAGNTDIDWNSQKTVIEKGQRLFVDTEYNIFPENEIVAYNKKVKK